MTQKQEEKEEGRRYEFILGETNLPGFKEKEDISYANYYEEYQEDEAVEIQKQGEN